MKNLQIIESLMDKGEYEKAAKKFLKLTGSKLSVKFNRIGSMKWDRKGNKRHIYIFSIEKDGRVYKDQFGQSIAAGAKKPSNYDILSCLSISYFEDVDQVASEFGITVPSQCIAIFEQDQELQQLFEDEEEQQMLNAIC